MTLPLAAASGGYYLAAAYLVFLALVLLYLVITASKAARLERDLTELADRLEEGGR